MLPLREGPPAKNVGENGTKQIQWIASPIGPKKRLVGACVRNHIGRQEVNDFLPGRIITMAQGLLFLVERVAYDSWNGTWLFSFVSDGSISVTRRENNLSCLFFELDRGRFAFGAHFWA